MSDLRRTLQTRIVHLGLRPEREAEIVEELAQHLDDRIRDLVLGGLDAADAEAAALADLDAPGELARQLAAIESRPRLDLPPPGTPSRGRWFQRRWQEIRHATRSLRRSPAFTATVVATLALTIGPTTAMLSIGNWLLWRPTPGVVQPDRLAVVWFGQWRETERGTSVSPSGVSYLNLADLRRASTTLGGVAGLQEGEVNLAAEGLAPAVSGAGWITADAFTVLGVRMAAGRPLAAEDDRFPSGAHVVVVSDGLARRAFGSPEGAVGGRVMLNGQPMDVVGVLAPGFVGTTPFSRVEVWYPGATYGYVNHFSRPLEATRSAGLFYSFIVRLAPDASFESAQAELDALVPALVTSHPAENSKFESVRARLYGGLGNRVLQRERYVQLVGILMAIGGALLLLGCANVANLIMLRGVRMARERAIRVALGASRSSLALLRLSESALLAVAGGALGIALAYGLKHFIVTLLLPGADVADTIDVPVDLRVLALTVGLSLTCGLTAGLAPALVDALGRLPTAVSDGGSRATSSTRRLRTGFAVVQLGLALALVTTSLLLIATLRNLQAVDLGFDARGVSMHILDPLGHGYGIDRAVIYSQEMLARAGSTPGVAAASLSALAPFGSGRTMQVTDPSGGEQPAIDVYSNAVTPEYFDVLGIRMIGGRVFTHDEAYRAETDAGSPVILSRRLALRLFGDQEPVGRRIALPRNSRSPARELTVIGVTEDIHWNSITEAPALFLYLPFLSNEFGVRGATLLIRSPLRFADVTRQIEAAAADLDSTLPLRRSQPLAANIERTLADQRVFAWVLTMLGWLGFTLAAVGLYGLLAQSVSERTREFGIRLAIGSGRGRIFGVVIRQAAVIGVVGTALGMALAVAGSRMVSANLYGVTPLEPWVFVAAAISLAGVVFLSGLWPALSATRIQPVEALRLE